MTVVTSSSVPNLSTISGVVQDPNSDLLYLSTTSGYIFTWNEATASFVSSFNVGHPLAAIAMSPDGKTLAVGEYSGNLDEYGGSPTTAVGLVNLSTHAVQTLTLGQVSGTEGGIVALGYDANGDILASADGQWIPYHFIPAGSQTFGSATVSGSSSISSASWIATSEDHRYLLLFEGNITGAPVQLYDTQAGKIIAQTNGYELGVDGFNTGTGAISSAAGLIADVVGGAVLVLNFSLQHAGGPGTTDSILGAQFNSTGSTLYLWDASTDSIAAYDTKSWRETASIPIPTSTGSTSLFPLNPTGHMSLSHDDRYLTLLTGSGFETIDLSNPLATTQIGDGQGGTLHGTSNGDVFIAARGSNNFTGVGGKDTVVFDFAYANYTVAKQSDNSLIVSSPAAGEGPDHLTNIQTLQFSDVTAQVTANGGLQVVAPLGTAATLATSGGSDLAGIEVSDSAANVQAGLDSLQTLVSGGRVSAVTLTDSGTPTITVSASQLAPDTTALKTITSSYTLAVYAPATANATLAGLGDAGHGTVFAFLGTASQYGVAGDGSGGVTVTGNGITDHFTGATALQFSDTTEILARTPGTGSTVTSGNIAELYAAVFGRQPDVAGLSFYTAALTAHPALGLTTFAGYFLASPEYTDNPAHSYATTNAGDSQFIADCYQNLLGRAPSASETSFYLTNVINPSLYGLTPGSSAYLAAETAAHAQVITYFSASAEFLKDVQVTSQNPASSQHWLMLI